MRRDVENKVRDDVSAMACVLRKGILGGYCIRQITQEERGVRFTLHGGCREVFTFEHTFGTILSEKALIDEQAEESYPECSTHESLLPEDL